MFLVPPSFQIGQLGIPIFLDGKDIFLEVFVGLGWGGQNMPQGKGG